MIEVAIMIEGQYGINWERWKRLGRTVEDLGYAGLYRSDHFTEPEGPLEDALELWTSLAWLADNTERIEFGPLVSPVSFRHPVITAWQASAVDNLAGGRLRLGVGAGWQKREHDAFGFDLLDTDRRFARFEEGLEVITRLVRSERPVSFAGEFYRLEDAVLTVRSPRPGGIPVVIGGNGPRRTLPLTARYADEWNAVFLTAGKFADLNAGLDGLLREAGRQPEEVHRTLMTRGVFGRTEAEVDGKLGGVPREDLDAAVIVGTADEFVDRLGRLEEAGVRRVMLQWLEADDVDGLEAMAGSVLPQL
ncbi:TIGR03560 family F420-dependent LLM class oxidoreductase [Rubrobacter tropicus]|uniref:TIGR03560 family F420-dependent LLM class oxidoreductase n=1 Tax=Rubrobacter tropicus TaxID=2653851 RepID=A0A6G8Q486_9ACTN|nr:TIGR03560 family F420-dependent LLM class oxidoreductase [Rubrobacter tropicus]QIN81304.1 TIGR03560 family F420-dependent LLM class oxidoreductase [Rubrobacter tropicus]